MTTLPAHKRRDDHFRDRIISESRWLGRRRDRKRCPPGSYQTDIKSPVAEVREVPIPDMLPVGARRSMCCTERRSCRRSNLTSAYDGHNAAALLVVGTSVPALARRQQNFAPSRDPCIKTPWWLTASSGVHSALWTAHMCPHRPALFAPRRSAETRPSRRSFLKLGVSGAAVTLCPLGVSRAQPFGTTAWLDGNYLVDHASRSAVATDFGGAVRRMPRHGQSAHR
jgi:hypothetical protein